MKRIIIALAIVSMFAACNSKKEKKQVKEVQNPYKGKVTATVPAKGMVQVYCFQMTPSLLDSVEIVDGKFTYEFDFKMPRELSFINRQDSWNAKCWADSSHVIITGKSYPELSEVIGGQMTRGEEHYVSAMQEFKKAWPSPFEMQGRMYKASKAKQKQIKDSIQLYKKKVLQFESDYIKNHPKNIYGANLIRRKITTKAGGEKASDLMPIFYCLDPSIHSHQFVADVKKILEEMLQSEVGLEQFIPNAKDTRYKVDKTYKGLDHQNIFYMSIFNDDNLCALVKGSPIKGQKAKEEEKPIIKIIDPTGKLLSSFEIKEEGDPTAVSVDENDLIYVTVSMIKLRKVKSRGRTNVFRNPLKSICVVYNKAGEVQKKYDLEGIIDASGLRIFNNQLVVSSCHDKIVKYFNKETGAPIRKVEDIRPCCSIMDIDVDQEGNLLVANLGSFRVTVYDTKGNKTISFGQRGKGINDFSGCCNPVSVRKLKNNCIVTVEKTPTRIKVYSKDGAHIIDGIEELVNGCYHIPIMSDSQANIYLASPTKGVVKCIETN
jgi:hypothetical protein